MVMSMSHPLPVVIQRLDFEDVIVRHLISLIRIHIVDIQVSFFVYVPSQSRSAQLRELPVLFAKGMAFRNCRSSWKVLFLLSSLSTRVTILQACLSTRV